MAAKLSTLRFKGLIRDQEFPDVSGPELLKAIRKAGWKEGTGTHFIKRLRKRGPALGIKTLGDLEREIARGRSEAAEDGKVLHRICRGNACIVYNPKTRTLITLTFGKE